MMHLAAHVFYEHGPEWTSAESVTQNVKFDEGAPAPGKGVAHDKSEVIVL